MNKIFLLSAFMVINTLLSAQIYDKSRHNTSYNSAWISCSPLQNPNSLRGTGHWINYNLGKNYNLYEITFWNLNDPSRLTEGLQDVVIDISENGIEWTEAGVFTIPKSEGSAYYKGINGINLNGSTARYVLVTAINNYGGDCYGLSEVKIGISESVLPVTLIDFSAQCTEDGLVSIKWEVESEYNNDSYTCQSSTNGIFWDNVANIPGENLKHKNTYKVIDKPSKANNIYYRVLQKNFDGSTSYFPVIKVRCNSFDNYLEINPNPVNNIATITLNATDDQLKIYQLTDIRGKVLKTGSFKSFETDIDLSQLSAGTYFITISDDRMTFQKKIIKI